MTNEAPEPKTFPIGGINWVLEPTYGDYPTSFKIASLPWDAKLPQGYEHLRSGILRALKQKGTFYFNTSGNDINTRSDNTVTVDEAAKVLEAFSKRVPDAAALHDYAGSKWVVVSQKKDHHERQQLAPMVDAIMELLAINPSPERKDIEDALMNAKKRGLE